MRLYEFTDPLIPRLMAVAGQLQHDLETQEVDGQMTVDQLLQYLSQYDIVVDVNDLYNMIKNPPLNKVISNIQGDQVIFKGQEEGTGVSSDQTQNQQVVAQMADKAASKM
jgi:hypothetical protein